MPAAVVIRTVGEGQMPPSSQKRDVAGSVHINLHVSPECS